MPRQAILALTAALVVAGCAVPLGPGFFIERETLDVRFVPASAETPAPLLQIRARFELTNTGNSPLDGIEVALPGTGYAFKDLRAEIAGRAIPRMEIVHGARGPDSVRWRLWFDAPLALKAKTTLTISYVLTDAREAISGRIAADAFFLPPGSWTPRPLPPAGLFATGGQRPKKFEMNVSVPPDFRVHAGGKMQRSRSARGASEVTHRFRIREDDVEPYILSGKFFESSYSAHGATVRFWTVGPMAQDIVQRTGSSQTAAISAFTALLGARNKGNKRVLLVYKSPGGTSGPKPREALSLVYPDAVVFGDSAPALEKHQGMRKCFVQLALAGMWFYHISKPQPEAQILSAALEIRTVNLLPACEHAWDMNGSDRSTYIRNMISLEEEIDELIAALPMTQEISETFREGRIQHRIVLFPLALDDELGAETVNRALRRMLQSLRGSTWGEHDLRAALEAESGRDLGAFFRAWLRSDEIPADFRAKYSKPQN
jgi:hypothetical protein